VAAAHLADGDVGAADESSRSAAELLAEHHHLASMNLNPVGDIAIARGDLRAAEQWIDEVAPAMQGWHLATVLTTSARRRLRAGDRDGAALEARRALAVAAEAGAHGALPDALDCLSLAAADHRDTARLLGAADALRRRQGAVRFAVYDADHTDSALAARAALGDGEFDAATAAGAAMSLEQLLQS